MKHLEPSEIEARRAHLQKARVCSAFVEPPDALIAAIDGWTADFEARVAAEAELASRFTEDEVREACGLAYGCGLMKDDWRNEESHVLAAIRAKREKGGGS